jgi:hypothetical protein
MGFTRWSLGIGLLVSVCVFAVTNLYYFKQPFTCFDCFYPYGLPFTFFREGGYAGGGGFVWTGMIGDFVIVLAFGIATAWLLSWLTRKR